ncbi:MAG: hypothetical protein HUJ24_05310 [Rhodobacteraceae bacterium]|nr:hypothetical protein [Paracoccaceae bacterium]
MGTRGGDSRLDQPGETERLTDAPASDVDAAAAQADTNPTDAQKEAGNYRKGHVTVQGLDISIENAK